MFTVKIHFAKVCGIVIYSVLDVVPYSLNILRGKIFADFAVLSVISKKFTLEIFRSPYVTGFAKRYLFHTQNLTHFLDFQAS